MKTIFLGSGDFARDFLYGLLPTGFELAGVITRPDRAAGRGLRQRPTPVKEVAGEEGISLYQPDGPSDPDFISVIEKEGPDLLLVADYGYILPREILDFPGGGCLNVHPSLLPRYRGAAPIRRALLQGERVSGVTLMLLDEGLDTGDIVAQTEVEVEDDDDALSLRKKLAFTGARMVSETVPLYMSGDVLPEPQDEGLATYAEPIVKSELLIDWTDASKHIHTRVRALSPRPGAYTYFRGKRLKVLRASQGEDSRTLRPGALAVYEGGILMVGTGEGCLRLERLQPEGKQPIGAVDFLNGYRPGTGEELGADTA